MKKHCLSIGTSFNKNSREKDILRLIERLEPVKDYIYDFHFAYHDGLIGKTGRIPSQIPKEFNLCFVRLMSIYGYHTTLLFNQVEEKNYEQLLDGIQEYVDNGLTGVCTQKIEFGRMIKDRYPNIILQGSCLSYKLTYEEFKDELDNQFDIVNPINNIIRDPYNLKRNHKLGLKQKILVTEGCLNHCPFEKTHRHLISNGKCMDHVKLCPSILKDKNNFNLFLKSNWVTIQRMIELEEYIDVLKLARGTIKHNSLEEFGNQIVKFVDRYIQTQKGNYINYNILEYTGALNGTYFNNILKHGIDSYIIDNNDMFNNMNNYDVLNYIKEEIFKKNNIN